jgi:hypothetical protein
VILLYFVGLSAAIKDKSELYARYPQLNSTETPPCIRGLSNFLINMHSGDNERRMTDSSMHQLNDLGSQDLCESA